MVKDAVRAWFLDRGFIRQVDAYGRTEFDDLLEQRDARITLYHNRVWLWSCWGVVNCSVYYSDPDLFAKIVEIIKSQVRDFKMIVEAMIVWFEKRGFQEKDKIGGDGGKYQIRYNTLSCDIIWYDKHSMRISVKDRNFVKYYYADAGLLGKLDKIFREPSFFRRVFMTIGSGIGCCFLHDLSGWSEGSVELCFGDDDDK